MGLYHNIYNRVQNETIAAYNIQWFSGAWSGWYVPGVNDLDGKFNINPIACGSFPQKATPSEGCGHISTITRINISLKLL